MLFSPWYSLRVARVCTSSERLVPVLVFLYRRRVWLVFLKFMPMSLFW